MSLATWMKEFYPIEATHVSKEDALCHSLKKWIGLRPKNLAKHGVVKRPQDGVLKDGAAYLEITTVSCALCVHHYERYAEEYGRVKCEGCPLFKIHNRRCDQMNTFENSEYGKFVREDDPEPMIKLIESAIQQKNLEKVI